MQSNSLQVSNVVDQIENCSGKRIACDLKEAIESGIKKNTLVPRLVTEQTIFRDYDGGPIYIPPCILCFSKTVQIESGAI